MKNKKILHFYLVPCLKIIIISNIKQKDFAQKNFFLYKKYNIKNLNFFNFIFRLKKHLFHKMI